MKRIIQILFVGIGLFASILSITAQVISRGQTVPIVSHTDFGIGDYQTIDSYLSPLRYSGTAFRIANEVWRNGYGRDKRWTNYQQIHLVGGYLLNRPRSNAQMQFDVGFKMLQFYRWSFPFGLHLSAGVGGNLQVGGGYNLGNSNNPYNGKVNLTAVGGICLNYGLRIGRQPIDFHYRATAPLIGVGLMPHFNQPYYSFMLYHLQPQNFHFTSWHNQQHIEQQLRIELPFRHYALSLGASHEYYASHLGGVRQVQSFWTAQVGFSIYLQRFQKL